MTCCLNPDCSQPINADDAEFCLSCGTKLTVLLRNRYRVERPLGQGGFGRTYLAEDRDRLRARCVIKQFSPSLQGSKGLEKAVQLFEQEAVRLYELGGHPHIPDLLAYFEHDKRLYLVQQYIEGQDLLQEMAQHGVFSERKVREVLARILPVLKYVHEHQVIHRDITPSNIIRRASDHRLVLIDFGVAKLLSTGDHASRMGTKIGTEGYAPMEQLRSGKAYPASDLYSLAATCLYLLTQIRPDDLYDPLEGRWIWRDHLQYQGSQISEPLARILDKMLKDSVNERYQTADQVIQDLKPILAMPTATVLAKAPVAAGEPSLARPRTAQFLMSSPEGEGVSRVLGGAAPPPVPTPPVSKQILTRSPRTGSPRTGSPTTGSPTTGSPTTGSPITGSPDARPLEARSTAPHSPTLGASTTGSAGSAATGSAATGSVPAAAFPQPISRPRSGGNGDGTQTQHSLHTLTGHSRWVIAVALSPDGTHLASGGLDDTIRVWNAQTGELLQVLTGHRKAINSLAYSPDGQWLISSSDDHTMRLWGARTGTFQREFTGHTRDVNAIAIHGDGTLLVSGSEDRSVRIWNLHTGEVLRVLSGLGMGMVRSVAISADAQRVASGGFDHQVKLWDLNTGAPTRPFIKGHFNTVNALVISPNGKTLVSASKDKTIKVWNLLTGEATRVLTEHGDAVNALAISPDGELLVSGSSDKTVRLWNLNSGKLMRTLTEHTNAVNTVAISRDNRLVVSGSSDNLVKVWQI
jgi:WD40 repeat protein